MNREIKFRAYDTRLKKWIYEDFHLLGEFMLFGGFDDYIKKNYIKDILWVERYNDIVIQQFTGLKDKNDKDIYEGDILLRAAAGYKYEVFWSTANASWMLKDTDGDCSIYLSDFNGLEVVENIYDIKN